MRQQTSLNAQVGAIYYHSDTLLSTLGEISDISGISPSEDQNALPKFHEGGHEVSSLLDLTKNIITQTREWALITLALLKQKDPLEDENLSFHEHFSLKLKLHEDELPQNDHRPYLSASDAIKEAWADDNRWDRTYGERIRDLLRETENLSFNRANISQTGNTWPLIEKTIENCCLQTERLFHEFELLNLEVEIVDKPEVDTKDLRKLQDSVSTSRQIMKLFKLQQMIRDEKRFLYEILYENELLFSTPAEFEPLLDEILGRDVIPELPPTAKEFFAALEKVGIEIDDDKVRTQLKTHFRDLYKAQYNMIGFQQDMTQETSS